MGKSPSYRGFPSLGSGAIVVPSVGSPPSGAGPVDEKWFFPLRHPLPSGTPDHQGVRPDPADLSGFCHGSVPFYAVSYDGGGRDAWETGAVDISQLLQGSVRGEVTEEILDFLLAK